MTRSLLLQLPLPPSLNHAYFNNGRGGRSATAKLAAFKKEATLLSRTIANHLGFEVGSSRLAIHLTFWFGDKKSYAASDIDNRCKPVMDALADGIGFNDRQVDEILLRRGAFDGIPRTIATIEVLS